MGTCPGRVQAELESPTSNQDWLLDLIIPYSASNKGTLRALEVLLARPGAPGCLAFLALDPLTKRLPPTLEVIWKSYVRQQLQILVGNSHRLQCTSFLVMTYFLLRGYNIKPKEELHSSIWVTKRNYGK